jgi:hypothetical protein
MEEMDSLLGMDLESSEHALRSLVAAVVHRGPRASAASAAPFLVALLDRGERPCAPHAILGLLARIAVADADAVACGAQVAHGGALEASPGELHAAREAAQYCGAVVGHGANIYLRWLLADDASARCAAAHLLAFIQRGDHAVDEALAARARDEDELEAVRASALFALGVRGTACAGDRPNRPGHEFGEATLLEAATVFSQLGSKDAAHARSAEREAIDVLARGVGEPSSRPGSDDMASFPWPKAERLLLGRLANSKGRSARAQSSLLRMLATARDRGRAERIACSLLVLAFGEPNAAAFSDWGPSREVFPGATAWSVEQRSVLSAVASTDVLWPPSAELEPSVRHVDASAVQLALKRMLVLPYYPSRTGLRAAINFAFTAGAGVAGQ